MAHFIQCFHTVKSHLHCVQCTLQTAMHSIAVHASADLHSVNAVTIVNEFDYNGDVHICMSMQIYMYSCTV